MKNSELDAMYARDRAEKLTDELKIRREDNAIVVNGIMRLYVKTGDNIMIVEDKFKSSYDCKVCKGAGIIKKTCLKCEGRGNNSLSKEITSDELESCGKCDGKGTWEESCVACNGKGALLEIPSEYQKKPTSGTIVSIGPDCKIYTVGERICYSSYTGNYLPFNKNDRIRIMRSTEPMCSIEEVSEEASSMDAFEFASADNPYEGITGQ